MTNSTAATLMATMRALKPALSLMPLTSTAVTRSTTRTAGRLMIARWGFWILASAGRVARLRPTTTCFLSRFSL